MSIPPRRSCAALIADRRARLAHITGDRGRRADFARGLIELVRISGGDRDDHAFSDQGFGDRAPQTSR